MIEEAPLWIRHNDENNPVVTITAYDEDVPSAIRAFNIETKSWEGLGWIGGHATQTEDEWANKCAELKLGKYFTPLFSVDLEYADGEEIGARDAVLAAKMLQYASAFPDKRFVPFSLPKNLSKHISRPLAAAIVCDRMDRYTANNPTIDFIVCHTFVNEENNVVKAYEAYSAGRDEAAWIFWNTLYRPDPKTVEFGTIEDNLACRYVTYDGDYHQCEYFHLAPGIELDTTRFDYDRQCESLMENGGATMAYTELLKEIGCAVTELSLYTAQVEQIKESVAPSSARTINLSVAEDVSRATAAAAKREASAEYACIEFGGQTIERE